MTTSTTNTVDVIGVGTYLEMRREHAGTIYTSQVIMIPETRRADVQVPLTMICRRISRIAPKKNWHTYSSPTMAAAAMSRSDSVEGAAHEMLKFAVSTLERHVNAGYKAVGEPIFFEVTREDASAVRQGKTPYKIIGRINKVRKEKKYPENVIA